MPAWMTAKRFMLRCLRGVQDRATWLLQSVAAAEKHLPGGSLMMHSICASSQTLGVSHRLLNCCMLSAVTDERLQGLESPCLKAADYSGATTQTSASMHSASQHVNTPALLVWLHDMGQCSKTADCCSHKEACLQELHTQAQLPAWCCCVSPTGGPPCLAPLKAGSSRPGQARGW